MKNCWTFLYEKGLVCWTQGNQMVLFHHVRTEWIWRTTVSTRKIYISLQFNHSTTSYRHAQKSKTNYSPQQAMRKSWAHYFIVKRKKLCTNLRFLHYKVLLVLTWVKLNTSENKGHTLVVYAAKILRASRTHVMAIDTWSLTSCQLLVLSMSNKASVIPGKLELP